MPSERFKGYAEYEPPLVNVEREEALKVLENRGSEKNAQLLWQRSEYDQSLRRQLKVIVLTARLSPNPDEKESRLFLDGLLELCEFEAEWRESDYGWAQFLTETVSSIEILLKRFPLESVRTLIQEIIQVAEDSSIQMDDCYSCELEIERMQQILAATE